MENHRFLTVNHQKYQNKWATYIHFPEKAGQKHPFLALQTARRGWASASDLWTWRFQRKSLSKRFCAKVVGIDGDWKGGNNEENHLGFNHISPRIQTMDWFNMESLRDTDTLVLYIQNIGVSYRLILTSWNQYWEWRMRRSRLEKYSLAIYNSNGTE